MTSESKSGVAKKKKNEVIVADGIDSTKSVKDIVDFLQSKNRVHKVFGYYCQTIRQRYHHVHKDYHYLIPGHPLNTFSDDWDGSLNSGYFEPFSHRSTLPKMISEMRNINKQDPITQLVIDTRTWNTLWNYYKVYVAKLSKKYRLQHINDDLVRCSTQYLDIVKHWENKPDHYFNDVYNWYYAGNGNLHIISLEGIDFLLHSEYNCVYLSAFCQDTLSIDYKDNASFDCGAENNILETVFCQNIVALRTKLKLFILKIVEIQGKIEFEKVKEYVFDLPLTSIAFDGFHTNILYVTALDFQLTVLNLDRLAGRSRKLRGRIASLVDNWSCVLGAERGCYLHASKSAVVIYDKRAGDPSAVWRSAKRVSDEKLCNDIGVARYRPGRPLVYLGTQHHMFLLDMRHTGNKNKVAAVQRWTHGAESVPAYMAVSDFEHDRELVALASQWPQDTCLVSAHRSPGAGEPGGVSVPYRPPGVLDALGEARERRLCCDISDPLDERLVAAVSGLAAAGRGQAPAVLMQNAFGDVWSHRLQPAWSGPADARDDAAERLHEWSRSYRRESTKDFEVSDVVDVGRAFVDLKAVPDDFKIGAHEVAETAGFSEKEIHDAFENQELDPGLVDVWVRAPAAPPDADATLGIFFAMDDDD